MRHWQLNVAIDAQNIPENWTQPVLEKVCAILDSKRIPVNNNERSKRIEGKSDNELYPYYGATGQVGVIDDYIFEDESILLGEDGAPFLDPFKEKAYLVNGKYWVNNHAHILKAYTNNKYLCHYLNQIDYSGHVTGTTRLKLTQGALKRIPVNFAPEPEQLRIVSKIEELFSNIDRGIESLKTAREQLKVYRQAVLKHAFEGKLTEQWRDANKHKLETSEQLLARIKKERDKRHQQQCEGWNTAVKTWEAEGKKEKKPSKPKQPNILAAISPVELKSLPELPSGWEYTRLCYLIDEPKYGTSRKCGYDTKGTGVLRIPNVAHGVIDASDLKFAQFEDDEMEIYNLKQGDILIIRSNGSLSIVGKCALISEFEEGYLYAGYLIRLRPNQALILPEFLISILSSHFLRMQIEKKAKSTSGVNNINSVEIQQLVVPICSIAEQREAMNHLTGILASTDTTEIEIEQQLVRSEALRQSILQHAFSGQLVEQDPNDESASILLERIRAEKAMQKGTHKKSNRRKTGTTIA